MPVLTDIFTAFWRVMVMTWLLFASPLAQAGSIGFSVSFTGDAVTITHTGNEAAYQFSLYTLDSTGSWQPLSVDSDNAAFLLPGKSLQGHRRAPAATAGLGRADPLLVLFHDQAGSRISQLAWRVAPATAEQALPTEREGSTLRVNASSAGGHNWLATYGITVPYEGIAQLTHPLSGAIAPPNPLLHSWASKPVMTLDTGTGQGGAWLVHEGSSGELQVQIVPDGKVRGTEQVPLWLPWVRTKLLSLAGALGLAGALLLLAGFFWPPRGRQPVQPPLSKKR